jgi:predicted ABC-type transport system involved in lysophospholipase L1 biosynthesis ATPase subunit
MVTHSDEVARNASRIVRLSDGRIVEDALAVRDILEVVG